MRNTLGIALVTAAALVLLELVLQVPLLRLLQPLIITPADGTLVTPPVQVRWEGPPRLRLRLVGAGAAPRDLGTHPSPFELSAADLSGPGSYRLQARAPLLGGLIQAERRFSVAPPPPTAAPSPPHPSDTLVAELKQSLLDLRAAHRRTTSENTGLYEENGNLRQENAKLMEEIERLTKANEDAASASAAQDDRATALQQQNRTLSEQLTMMQWQLNAALTCTVWGFYSYPHPQTIPPTRRAVTVTDLAGNVFRRQEDCEAFRQNDPTAASRCFCVGTPWRG